MKFFLSSIMLRYPNTVIAMGHAKVAIDNMASVGRHAAPVDGRKKSGKVTSKASWLVGQNNGGESVHVR